MYTDFLVVFKRLEMIGARLRKNGCIGEGLRGKLFLTNKRTKKARPHKVLVALNADIPDAPPSKTLFRTSIISYRLII